jgi:hypothetical protein
MSKNKTAVFRAKTHSCWEDCEIIFSLKNATIDDADIKARQLSEEYNLPIRWNWVGSEDGHFFRRYRS